MGRILGIDHGSVRIGIAISDDTCTIAFGREVIAAKNDPFKRSKEIVESENVTQIVIGYPLNLKGERTQQTLETEHFEEQLRERFKLPPFDDLDITRWDERFTSKIAADSQISSGMKKKKRQDKSQLDIISASLMLQSYLDSRKNEPRESDIK
jgi:putative holliday junction resolvase